MLDLSTPVANGGLGFVGDGVTVNTDGMALLDSLVAAMYAGYSVFGDVDASNTLKAHAIRIRLRVRPGRYLIPAGAYGSGGRPLGWYQHIEWEGTHRDACVIACADPNSLVSNCNIFDHIDNLTVENVQRSSWNTPPDVRMTNSRWVHTVGDPFKYMLNATPDAQSGVNGAGSVWLENMIVEAPAGYVGIWCSGAKNVTVRGCTVTGDFSHCIRVENIRPGGRVEISGCHTKGGKTGIFFPSNRVNIIERVLIQGNRVEDFREEGISLDGMGNNPGLLSVIGDGTISAVGNDATGRLVITPSLVCRSLGGTNDVLPVSAYDNWTSFYAVFAEGSGIPGAYARVYSFDPVLGTLTLDTFTPAASVVVGGSFGVHGGFWGCTIRDNELHSLAAYEGIDDTYNVGISLWLDCYETLVENNRIVGCAQGISVASGLLFGSVEARAFGNTIRGNKLIRCHQKTTADNGSRGAIRIEQYFGGADRVQYGNRCRDNIVDGGKVWISGQDDAEKVWGIVDTAKNELRNGASVQVL